MRLPSRARPKRYRNVSYVQRIKRVVLRGVRFEIELFPVIRNGKRLWVTVPPSEPS